MTSPAFQTDPCGVEAARWQVGQSRFGWFQTDPCGVEASPGPHRPSRCPGFRRTLVGLKPMELAVDGDGDAVSDGPLWG